MRLLKSKILHRFIILSLSIIIILVCISRINNNPQLSSKINNYKGEVAGVNIVDGNKFLSSVSVTDTLASTPYQNIASNVFISGLLGVTGNIGIGNTNPDAKLMIQDTDGRHLRFEGRADLTGFQIRALSDNLILSTGATKTDNSALMMLTEGGNVGISVLSPQAKLDVGAGDGKFGNGYVVGTRQGNNYRIEARHVSRSCPSTNNWDGVGWTFSVAFSGQPVCLSNITYNNNNGPWDFYNATCTTSGMQTNYYCRSSPLYLDQLAYGPTAMTTFDLAESYKTQDQSISSGDVVCIDPKNNSHIVKCSVPYDHTAIGMVSTNPGLIIGDDQSPDSRLVGLQGRAPVKITLENGPIERGDPLTPSATKPGYAMKAIKAGQIIGKALQPFDGNSTVLEENAFDGLTEDQIKNIIKQTQTTGEGETMAFINISWYDPDAYLISVDDTTIQESNNSFSLKNKDGSIVDRVGIFAETIIAKLEVGVIETRKLFVSGINILEKLNELSKKVEIQQREINSLKQQVELLKSKQ
jgi:hypothetical protein